MLVLVQKWNQPWAKSSLCRLLPKYLVLLCLWTINAHPIEWLFVSSDPGNVIIFIWGTWACTISTSWSLLCSRRIRTRATASVPDQAGIWKTSAGKIHLRSYFHVIWDGIGMMLSLLMSGAVLTSPEHQQEASGHLVVLPAQLLGCMPSGLNCKLKSRDGIFRLKPSPHPQGSPTCWQLHQPPSTRGWGNSNNNDTGDYYSDSWVKTLIVGYGTFSLW